MPPLRREAQGGCLVHLPKAGTDSNLNGSLIIGRRRDVECGTGSVWFDPLSSIYAQIPLVGFVVDLLHNLLYNKSTANRINGV